MRTCSVAASGPGGRSWSTTVRRAGGDRTGRRIVEADDLGAVADPNDPADLARALAGILDRPPAAAAALRDRCARVSRETFAWEVVDRDYRALVGALVPAVGPVAGPTTLAPSGERG